MPKIIPMRVVAVSCKGSRVSDFAHTATWWTPIIPDPAVRRTARSERHLGSLLCSNVSGIACERKVLRESRPRGASCHTCTDTVSLK